MRTSGYVQRNHSTSVQVVGFIRPVGAELQQKLGLVLVHFGLIKLKPNQNTSVFPTTLHLSSAPASIPHVGAI